MIEVRWSIPARGQLATIWGDAKDRNAITAAVHAIDRASGTIPRARENPGRTTTASRSCRPWLWISESTKMTNGSKSLVFGGFDGDPSRKSIAGRAGIWAGMWQGV